MIEMYHLTVKGDKVEVTSIGWHDSSRNRHPSVIVSKEKMQQLTQILSQKDFLQPEEIIEKIKH